MWYVHKEGKPESDSAFYNDKSAFLLILTETLQFQLGSFPTWGCFLADKMVIFIHLYRQFVMSIFVCLFHPPISADLSSSLAPASNVVFLQYNSIEKSKVQKVSTYLPNFLFFYFLFLHLKINSCAVNKWCLWRRGWRGKKCGGTPQELRPITTIATTTGVYKLVFGIKGNTSKLKKFKQYWLKIKLVIEFNPC